MDGCVSMYKDGLFVSSCQTISGQAIKQKANTIPILHSSKTCNFYHKDRIHFQAPFHLLTKEKASILHIYI